MLIGEIQLTGFIDEKEFLEPGWKRVKHKPLPTFTTVRPSDQPGRKPAAGLSRCDEATLSRWKEDQRRFPPYQYREENCLTNRKGALRMASVTEREVTLEFPAGYTRNCAPKNEQKGFAYECLRHTLLGNSWSVPVVMCLLYDLFKPLGLISDIRAQGSGHAPAAYSRKGRTFAACFDAAAFGALNSEGQRLVSRLSSVVSIKGDDIMIQGTTEDPARYHRWRASVPARL